MATRTLSHKPKTVANTRRATKVKHKDAPREIAAGEFKAKCLAIIDHVSKSGQAVVITKRGKPMAKLIPFQETSVDSLFGRLKGIVTIIGDPDDLVNPIIPVEDWDSLK